MKNIGPAIAHLRYLRQLTLDNLAERTELSKPFLSMIENGKRGLSLDSFHRIANVLDIHPLLLHFLACEERDLEGLTRPLLAELEHHTRGMKKGME